MKRILYIGALFVALAVPAAWSEMVEARTMLAQADAAYAKREDVSQATIALEYYEKLGELGGIYAAEGYWKAARAAWWVAEHTEKRADKLALYQQGIEDAKKSIALKDADPAAHFWLGCDMGSFGDTKGVMKSLSLVKPIRHEMQEVLRLDEKFADGGAWRVLGVVDYKVPGLMGGSKARAQEELEKALALGPDNPFNRYYLAEYYKTVGKKEEKEAQVTALSLIQNANDLGPELKMMQGRAGRL